MHSRSLPRLLLRLAACVRLRCPHCGEGRILRHPYAAHPACPVCGLAFQRDEGDFWGTVVFAYTFGGIAGLAAAAALLRLGVERWQPIAFAASGAALAAILLTFPFARSLWIHLLYLTRGHYEEYRPPDAGAAGRRAP